MTLAKIPIAEGCKLCRYRIDETCEHIPDMFGWCAYFKNYVIENIYLGE
jgi:hypothetical protein